MENLESIERRTLSQRLRGAFNAIKDRLPSNFKYSVRLLAAIAALSPVLFNQDKVQAQDVQTFDEEGKYSYSIPETEGSVEGSLCVMIDPKNQTINLRSGPGTNFTILAAAGRSNVLVLKTVEKTDNWFNVYLSDGTEAWIRSDLTTEPMACEGGFQAAEEANERLLQKTRVDIGDISIFGLERSGMTAEMVNDLAEFVEYRAETVDRNHAPNEKIIVVYGSMDELHKIIPTLKYDLATISRNDPRFSSTTLGGIQSEVIITNGGTYLAPEGYGLEGEHVVMAYIVVGENDTPSLPATASVTVHELMHAIGGSDTYHQYRNGEYDYSVDNEAVREEGLMASAQIKHRVDGTLVQGYYCQFASTVTLVEGCNGYAAVLLAESERKAQEVIVVEVEDIQVTTTVGDQVHRLFTGYKIGDQFQERR